MKTENMTVQWENGESNGVHERVRVLMSVGFDEDHIPRAVEFLACDSQYFDDGDHDDRTWSEWVENEMTEAVKDRARRLLYEETVDPAIAEASPH